MFIDTHCHLNMMVDRELDKNFEEKGIQTITGIIEEAKHVGVAKIINIGTNLNSTVNSIYIAKKIDSVFATAGIHPCDWTFNWRSDLKKIKDLLDAKYENKIVGIGEVGLDFYHKEVSRDKQNYVFKAFIELALEYELPIIIHSRDAHDEMLKILQEYVKNGLKGVLHCFSHPKYVADQIISWKLNIGIGAYITYPKNFELRDLIQEIFIGSIILETDAPFLPPQQYRGKPNKPSYIPLVAQEISKLKQIPIKALEEQTSSTALGLFRDIRLYS